MKRRIFVSKRKLQFCRRESAKQTGRTGNAAGAAETCSFAVKADQRRKEMCDLYEKLCPSLKESLMETARKLRDVRR